MPTLSFLLPSIRLNLLPRAYESIQKAYSGDFEVIVVSPYDQPASFVHQNVIWIDKEFGNVCVCRQKALLHATGDYVTWAADDAVYLEGALDKAMKCIDQATMTTLMMTEGNTPDPASLTEPHYRAWFHKDLRLPYIPQNTLLLMFGIVPRNALVQIGGWDCRFEGPGEADVDLSIRLRRFGLREYVVPFHAVKVDHEPGTTGTHAPIHNSHFEHDLPLFQKIYSDKESESRIEIRLDNWKAQPVRWRRRFGS